MNPTFQHLIGLLAPYVTTPQDRKALLMLALEPGSPLLNQIEWTGNAQTLLANAADTLHRAGNLIPLLETVKTQVGVNREAEFDTLISQIRRLPPDSFAANIAPKATATLPRLFLSYARADDEPYRPTRACRRLRRGEGRPAPPMGTCTPGRAVNQHFTRMGTLGFSRVK